MKGDPPGDDNSQIGVRLDSVSRWDAAKRHVRVSRRWSPWRADRAGLQPQWLEQATRRGMWLSGPPHAAADMNQPVPAVLQPHTPRRTRTAAHPQKRAPPSTYADSTDARNAVRYPPGGLCRRAPSVATPHRRRSTPCHSLLPQSLGRPRPRAKARSWPTEARPARASLWRCHEPLRERDVKTQAQAVWCGPQ